MPHAKIPKPKNTAYSFEFDIDLRYGSLRGTEGLNMIKERLKSSEKYYFGNYGGSSSNKINIQSDYGSVTFKRN